MCTRAASSHPQSPLAPLWKRGEETVRKAGKWYALNDVRKCINDLNHEHRIGQTLVSLPAPPEAYFIELNDPRQSRGLIG